MISRQVVYASRHGHVQDVERHTRIKVNSARIVGVKPAPVRIRRARHAGGCTLEPWEIVSQLRIIKSAVLKESKPLEPAHSHYRGVDHEEGPEI